MLYNSIKIIHILAACLLIGSPLASAVYLFCLRHQQDLRFLFKAYQFTLKLNLCLMGFLGLLQPLTGFLMATFDVHHFGTRWLSESVAAYALAAVFWLLVMFFHARSGHFIEEAMVTNQRVLPSIYYRYVKWRKWFGFLALVFVLFAFFIMTSKM